MPLLMHRQQVPQPPNIGQCPCSFRVPDTRQRKLGIRFFDGKELYQGLVSGFSDSGRSFLRQVNLAQLACGFQWSEEIKADLLGHNLSGIAERYFNKQLEAWWLENHTLSALHEETRLDVQGNDNSSVVNEVAGK